MSPLFCLPRSVRARGRHHEVVILDKGTALSGTSRRKRRPSEKFLGTLSLTRVTGASQHSTHLFLLNGCVRGPKHPTKKLQKHENQRPTGKLQSTACLKVEDEHSSPATRRATAETEQRLITERKKILAREAKRVVVTLMARFC